MKKKVTLLVVSIVVLLATCGLLIARLTPPAELEAVTEVAKASAAPLITVAKATVTDSAPIIASATDTALTEKAKSDAKKAEESQKTTETQKAESAKTTEETKKTAESEKSKDTATSSLPNSSTGVKALGVVSGSDVRMRSSAGTDGSILATLSKGTAVAIKGVSGDWYQVSYNGNSGYMSSQYVTANSSISGLTAYGKVTADTLNMRSGAGSGNSVVTTLSNGTYVDITGFESGWYAVKTATANGYVSGDYITIVSSKATNPTAASATAATTAATTATAASGTGAQIAAKAKEYLGCSYSYGGSGPSSFDCSGFTMYIYGLFNYSLPHGASDQYGYGTAVDKSNLQPGDLVFFSYNSYAIGHVGIYLGDGNFIHASTYGVGVIISSLNEGSYPSRYVGARRIV